MVGNDTIHTVTRKEHDCIGYMDVPKDVYWGIHTQRALGNFTVSRIADSTHPQLMRAYATVKRACAEANDELGLIDHDKARLLVAACRDVENGELADQFPVDVLQGGAGTSTNMNMNEVIANRALELGGHSKGGNMAVYAAMQITQSDIEATNERAQRLGLLPALGGSVPGRNCRISRIFSHDGPGMSQVMVHSRAYQAIAARIDKTVPESSIIGMLLQSQIKPTFVKADAISILQHMGSSWQVTQSGEFEQASELTGGAQLIGKTIDGWFDRVSQEQRERAINQIYDIFAAAGYGNIADLVAHWTDSLPKIVAAARGTDVQTRELIKDVFKAIPASAAKVAVGELRNDKEGDA